MGLPLRSPVAKLSCEAATEENAKRRSFMPRTQVTGKANFSPGITSGLPVRTSVGSECLGGAVVPTARAAQVGMACKKEKSVGDGIDQAVGDFKATALFGDVIPDIVQVGGGLRRYAVRHQRDAGRSLARRAWPRCFTSSSSRID